MTPDMLGLADCGCILEFDLPISRLGNKADPSLKSLGSGQPVVESYSNPMCAPETHWLLATIQANPSGWDKAVNDLMAANTDLTQLTEDHYEIMKAVPFEPGRRIVEEASA